MSRTIPVQFITIDFFHSLCLLKKACGYHLDLLWVGILLVTCSFLGLPWYVAATVISIAHIDSLKMESESSAPGEQPQFLGVRWDRHSSCMFFFSNLPSTLHISAFPFLTVSPPIPENRDWQESWSLFWQECLSSLLPSCRWTASCTPETSPPVYIGADCVLSSALDP